MLRLRRSAVVTAVYAVLAAGWIYASDALLGFLIPDPALLTAIETYKGFLFVAVTAAFLFSLLRHDEQPAARTAPSVDGLSIWPPLAMLLVFVLIVAATAALVYRHIASTARVHAHQTVAAVADLELGQLAGWLDDRRHDGEAVTRDTELAFDIAAWLRRGSPDDDAAHRIAAQLDTLRTLHGWTRVSIVDAGGRALMVTGGGTPARLATPLPPTTTLLDLHRAGNDVELGFIAPVISESRALAAVIMETSAGRFVFPMIRNWPLPSASGETLLVRRDGDSVLYLNAPRHFNAQPLKLRVPLTRASVVARNAVLGARGPVTGVDYRGVPVLAMVRSVPSTSWLLITKVDLDEINGPIAEAARLLALFGLILVLAAGLTTALWVQRQRASASLRQFESERERTKLAKHLDSLTRYANDIIMLIDPDGTIVDANERAIAAYGYARRELIGSNIRRLRPEAQLASFEEQWIKSGDEHGTIFETIHRRKDGTTFPAEVSSRGIEVDGAMLRQSIIRDITDRKEAERNIVRLTNRYAALSDMNQAIVRGKNRRGLLAELCRVAVEFGGAQFASLVMTGDRTPVEYGRAKTKHARTFPLLKAREAIGELTVYGSDASFFDTQTVALFDEITDDVSFALENLAKEAALRESEEKYRLLFTREQDGLALFDADSTQFIDANDAFLKLTGYGTSEIGALKVGDVSADPHAAIRALQKVRENGSDRSTRRIRRRDGSEIWAEIDMNAFEWRGRELVSAIVRDITDKKKAEESALLWANVLEESTEGILITDAERRILTVNKAFTTLTGYSEEEVIGRMPSVLKSGRHDDGFYRQMWRQIAEAGRWQGEIWNRRRDGEVYPEWLSITAVHNAGELTHYVGIFSDITERKESAARIEFLANHDFLTGLPNRSIVADLIHQAVANAQRRTGVVGLLFLDLDRFKTINDSLGHATGDTLLQRIAMRLLESVRAEDTVARIGGDEFLIVLPELARDQDAAVVAEKLMAAVKKPLAIEGHDLAVTASVGISLYPHDGDDVAALIRNADSAMYHAKERGRNNYQFFTPDMNARASEALAMTIGLRAALERDEFRLHYQPQVETATGRIIGAEALIRWEHRTRGLITADRFIPIAEEHGLIVPIGEWVLRTVCRQLRQWLDEGLPVVPVAVNMSAVQFRQPGLAGRLRKLLDETGVAPKYLELEVTETIIMRDAEQAISVLRELDGMGLSLAIDDFGTGYSSLNYLRRFPIGKLKIDQSFVHDITTNPDAAAIAAAIVSMGKSLKLRVIAEGVETEEQLEFLAQRDCDELQGFHIGRPMEAARFSDLLREDAVLPKADRRAQRLRYIAATTEEA